MQLNIAIVGGGISGLACAIALSRDGHTVNVYERRSNTQQLSGSGLQIQPSAVKILRKWGLLDGFAKVAHESGGVKFKRYANGKLIAQQERKGSRAQWYCLRNALRQYLYEAALASGAIVHFDARVQSLDLNAPSLALQDGAKIHADLIIAADGTSSFIRQLISPGAERKLTNMYVFQVNIPRETMYEHQETVSLYQDPAIHVYLGQNTWSFISVAPNQSIYDMQLVCRGFADSGLDPHPERLLEPLENLDMLGDWIDTWDPAYREVLAKGTSFFKWRVAEAPHIPTAVAKSGKVVLVGDAYHGIDPSAGFGTALSLEDGYTLSLLIARCSSPAQLPTYLGIFDQIMKKRAGAISKYSTFMGAFLGLPDGPMQKMRDQRMGAFDPNATVGAKPNHKAKFGTAEWLAWMDDYDPVKVVEDAMSKHREATDLKPGSIVSRI